MQQCCHQINMVLSLAHMKLRVNTTVGCRDTGSDPCCCLAIKFANKSSYSQNGLMMIQAKFGGDPMNTTLAESNLLVH